MGGEGLLVVLEVFVVDVPDAAHTAAAAAVAGERLLGRLRGRKGRVGLLGVGHGHLREAATEAEGRARRRWEKEVRDRSGRDAEDGAQHAGRPRPRGRKGGKQREIGRAHV